MKQKILILASILALISTYISKLNAETNVIELKLVQMHTPPAPVAQVTVEMIDLIHKKTQGRLKITPYWGETLVKEREIYRATQTGVVDIAYFGPNIAGSPVILGRVISLPFLGLTSHVMVGEVYSKLFQESPELQREYKGLKVVGIDGLPLDNLHTTRKLIRVPSDARGIKILTMGIRAEVLKEVGAVPITVPATEWYTSLERKLAEGVLFHFPFIIVYKLQDFFKFHTVLNATSGVLVWIFNEQKWNSLPEDLQNVILEAMEWRTKKLDEINTIEEKKAIEHVKIKGHVVHYCSDSELEQWRSATEKIRATWIQEMEQKGLPGKKIYERMMQIIAEYKEAHS